MLDPGHFLPARVRVPMRQVDQPQRDHCVEDAEPISCEAEHHDADQEADHHSSDDQLVPRFLLFDQEFFRGHSGVVFVGFHG